MGELRGHCQEMTGEPHLSTTAKAYDEEDVPASNPSIVSCLPLRRRQHRLRRRSNARGPEPKPVPSFLSRAFFRARREHVVPPPSQATPPQSPPLSITELPSIRDQTDEYRIQDYGESKEHEVGPGGGAAPFSVPAKTIEPQNHENSCFDTHNQEEEVDGSQISSSGSYSPARDAFDFALDSPPDRVPVLRKRGSQGGGSTSTNRLRRGMSSRRMSLNDLTVPDDFTCVNRDTSPALPPDILPMVANGLVRLAIDMKKETMTDETWEVCFSILRVRDYH